MSDELKGIVKPGAVPIAETPDGPKLFREEDLEEGARVQRRKAEARAQGPEHARALREAAAFPGWEYAITDQPLPHNADAAIVRDPQPGRKRVLVFNKKSLNDRLASLARISLAFSEREPSTINETKIVLIWSDGQIEIDGKKQSLGLVSTVERGDAAQMLQRTGKVVLIPGIGTVRIVGTGEEF